MPARTMTHATRLLIVRTSAMGDIIHTLPAVAALRECFPNSMIGWVVEERWVELLCSPSNSLAGRRSPGRPLVDRIHRVNTKDWRRSLSSSDTWRQIASSVHDLRAANYDVAIDFQGALRSGLIARFSGANEVYGFANPREGPVKMFYSQRVPAQGAHIVEQNCSLAEALAGRHPETARAELPRDESADRECDRYLNENRISGFALLNPRAGWGAKEWLPERYGEVARGLSEQGLRFLVNYGPGEENVAQVVESSSGGCAKPIKLTLTQLIAFTRRARLFVGGDTGPMHLATALNVPVVAIFGPTDPVRNGPFNSKSIVLRSPLSVTSYKRKTQPDEGMLTIGADEVIGAARRLLRDAHA